MTFFHDENIYNLMITKLVFLELQKIQGGEECNNITSRLIKYRDSF